MNASKQTIPYGKLKHQYFVLIHTNFYDIYYLNFTQLTFNLKKLGKKQYPTFSVDHWNKTKYKTMCELEREVDDNSVLMEMNFYANELPTAFTQLKISAKIFVDKYRKE